MIDFLQRYVFAHFGYKVVSLALAIGLWWAVSHDPVAEVEALDTRPHPRIPLPRDLFGTRRNSEGVNLADSSALMELAQQMQGAAPPWSAAPLVGGRKLPGKPAAV